MVSSFFIMVALIDTTMFRLSHINLFFFLSVCALQSHKEYCKALRDKQIKFDSENNKLVWIRLCKSGKTLRTEKLTGYNTSVKELICILE